MKVNADDLEDIAMDVFYSKELGPDRSMQILQDLVSRVRAETLEEAAKVVESLPTSYGLAPAQHAHSARSRFAAAIRAIGVSTSSGVGQDEQ